MNVGFPLVDPLAPPGFERIEGKSGGYLHESGHLRPYREALNQKPQGMVSPQIGAVEIPLYNGGVGDCPMKKPPSKTDLRERLRQQTAAFLSSGGKVKEFRPGESAYDSKEKPPPAPLFETRRAKRTPLTDVIAALDSRRAAKRARTTVVRRRTQKRRRQVVYDDFGEPLRVVWVEE